MTVKYQEALNRAKSSVSIANHAVILTDFHARGIPLDDIKPCENVFTYAAWQALGRQVRKGESGVKISTFIPYEKKVTDDSGNEKTVARRAPRTVSVFHISQTDEKDDN